MAGRLTVGGVEGGGTKFVCAVGTDFDQITASTTIPTTDPDETLGRIAEFFVDHTVAALGVATFGPLDLNAASPTYGHVVSTPKEAWSGADVAGMLHAALDVPIAIDTDVNGAAIGEGRWGAAQGLDTFLYVTVGTGIGGGGLINDAPMHGMAHPEIGHMRIPRHPDDDYPGGCPYHGDCLEGLAAGPAIAERWGQPGEALGAEASEAVALEAFYLGTAIANLTVTVSPQRIILGGGVMGLAGLLEASQAAALERLAGYVTLGTEISDFLVAPGLGERSGVLGAIGMARDLGSVR